MKITKILEKQYEIIIVRKFRRYYRVIGVEVFKKFGKLYLVFGGISEKYV